MFDLILAMVAAGRVFFGSRMDAALEVLALGRSGRGSQTQATASKN